jgi:hypothetical protein
MAGVSRPDDLTTGATEPVRFIQRSAQPMPRLGHRFTANGAPDVPASFGEVLGAAFFTIATRANIVAVAQR